MSDTIKENLIGLYIERIQKLKYELEEECSTVMELREENARLKELLSEIKIAFETEPYFKSTGRTQIAFWIKSIKDRIAKQAREK